MCLVSGLAVGLYCLSVVSGWDATEAAGYLPSSWYLASVLFFCGLHHHFVVVVPLDRGG
jgi:hypothetical protein